MCKTRALVDSMGRDWWDDLSYEDKVGYHAKVAAEEMWEGDYKGLVEGIAEETGLSKMETMMLMMLVRVDWLQTVFCKVHGQVSIGYSGPPKDD